MNFDESLALVRDCSLVLASRPTCTNAALASPLAISEQPPRNSGAGCWIKVEVADIT